MSALELAKKVAGNEKVRNVAVVLDPRMYLSAERRRGWAEARIDHNLAQGRITDSVAQRLREDINDPAMSQHILDIYFTNFGALAINNISSLALAAYGIHIGELSLVTIAGAQHLPLIPKISVGGIARALWLGGRAVQDHLIERRDPSTLISPRAEVANTVASLVSPVGHFSALIRLNRANPSTAGFFASHFISEFGTLPKLRHRTEFLRRGGRRLYGLFTKFDFERLTSQNPLDQHGKSQLLVHEA